MTIKEFDKETEEILDERVITRRKLERDQINKHIAERDARRVEKQRLEDMGHLHLHIPPVIEPTEETSSEEEIPTESKIKKFKEKFVDAIKKREEPIIEETVEKILEEELIPEEIIEEALKDEFEGEATGEKIIEDTPPPSEAIVPPLPVAEEPKIDEVLDAQKQLREAVVEAKKELNSNIPELEQIKQEWIDEYKEETGKNAIWNGKITKGFKDFCQDVLNIDLG